ncbi:uncharacterized protein [Littorina saxatilis]|uniref:Ubiquitin-like domain-containing protein n=1 Tax=Littorina saxatilis TaxID=31220 RepID=A0AAN9BNL9_9CAEN
MQIFVKTLTGRTLTLQVDSQDTIAKVKSLIEEQEPGFYQHQQKLLLGRSQLDDDWRLHNGDVQEGCTLYLLLRTIPMRVFVKTLQDKTVTLETNPPETVDNVLAKLEEQEGIEACRHRLKFGSKLLNAGCTLLQQHIQHKSTLTLCPRILPITIRRQTGRAMLIEVNLSDTVARVKQKIREQEGIPAEQQTLKLHAKDLMDHLTVCDYNITEGCSLDMILCPVTQVFLKTLGGTTVSLETKPSDTVGNILAKVAEKERYPLQHYYLECEAKKLDTRQTLAEQNVPNKATLYLCLRPIPITVRRQPTGRAILVEVKISDTVASVKQKIREQEGIPAEQQTLKLHAKDLMDHLTVCDYNITEGCSLDMILRPVTQVFVKTPRGKTVGLETQPSDTVGNILVQCAEKERYPLQHYYLQIDARKLDTGLTLLEQNVPNKATLQLCLRLFPITVRQRTGQAILMHVNLSDTIASVKQKIYEEAGILAEQQTLKLHAKDLMDHLTVCDYNITEGCSLDMILRHGQGRR